MAGNSTNVFYGNKVIHKNIDGYFCSVEFDPKATGEHITELRRSHHFSREEFVYRLFEAGLLRVSVTTMGKWERGEVKNLELGQVEALCRFFGCSHDELVVYRDRGIDTEHDQPVFYPALIGFPEDGNLPERQVPIFFCRNNVFLVTTQTTGLCQSACLSGILKSPTNGEENKTTPKGLKLSANSFFSKNLQVYTGNIPRRIFP